MHDFGLKQRKLDTTYLRSKKAKYFIDSFMWDEMIPSSPNLSGSIKTPLDLGHSDHNQVLTPTVVCGYYDLLMS